MHNEMIKRVAEAIELQGNPRAMAIAAIKAMREPTEKMLDAARDWSRGKYGKPIGNDAANGCYRAIIDAIIND